MSGEGPRRRTPESLERPRAPDDVELRLVTSDENESGRVRKVEVGFERGQLEHGPQQNPCGHWVRAVDEGRGGALLSPHRHAII